MYDVALSKGAEKDIAALPSVAYRRVVSALASLRDNPRPSGIHKLATGEGYRIRLGDYRIVLTIDDDARAVTGIRVRHRREAYRGW